MTIHPIKPKGTEPTSPKTLAGYQLKYKNGTTQNKVNQLQQKVKKYH